MLTIIRQLTTITLEDSLLRRQAQVVVVLSLALLVFMWFMVPLLLLIPTIPDFLVLIAAGGATTITLGAINVARRGRVGVGALFLLAVLIIAPLAVIPVNRGITATAMALTLSIVLSSLVLRPWQIWLVYVVNVVGLACAAVLLADADQTEYVILASNVVVLSLLTLFCFLAARITNASLWASETASSALASVNAALEQRVADRTSELEAALHEVQHRAATQERLLQELAEQRALMNRLSVPVLPISPTVLVVPLVGALDRSRLDELQVRALQAVEAQRASFLILDATGVALVDTQVANGLMQVVRAARLLGAQVVLVGVRPELAQTMVSLGLSLADVVVRATLQDGIASVTAPRGSRALVGVGSVNH